VGRVPLARAAARAGCDVRSGVTVRALLIDGGRVRGVRLDDGSSIACDALVLAAGAWSGALDGLPRPLPVHPVKGQMIALAEPSGGLRTCVETERCYLIPRPGRVWVGATSEHVGFARGTSVAARSALHAAAALAVPELARSPELEAWDGFRPATSDELPVLGADPDVNGLVHASGHFRNGILLTPVTAELIARAVRGDADPRLDAFRPDRFAQANGPVHSSGR
jgi:glycine oxidase